MAEHISLPWANEVPPESVWSTLRHKAAALQCSLRRRELSSLSSLSSSSHFNSQLIPPPPSLPPSVFPCVLPFFLLALNQQALFSSSRHRYTLSLSWDPFDVVRHNEIPLHLGQFSVWRLILHEPISRASQHTGTHARKHMYCTDTQAAHTPIHHPTNPTMPLSGKMKQDEYVGSHTHMHTHKEDISILLFFHAGKERSERHHGYYPSGAE